MDYNKYETYLANDLSTKLVVQDHTADSYRVFDSFDEFWDFSDNTPPHLRCFSEVVFEDTPQTPMVHVGISSRSKMPKKKIVGTIESVITSMLEVFHTSYHNTKNVPISPKDLVVMDECGLSSHGFWIYSFHILAPSFSFSGYQEASIFLDNVALRVPKKIRQYLFLPCSPPTQYIRILDSTFPDDARNKKISSYSRYLGTATDIPRNGLFVNHFPDLKVDSVSQTTSENYCNNISEKTNEPIQADEVDDPQLAVMQQHVLPHQFTHSDSVANGNDCSVSFVYSKDAIDENIPEIVDSLEKDNHENTVTNEIDRDNFNEDSIPETEEDVISSIIETRSIGHDMPISDKTDTSVNDNVHGMEANITPVNLSNTETQLVEYDTMISKGYCVSIWDMCWAITDIIYAESQFAEHSPLITIQNSTDTLVLKGLPKVQSTALQTFNSNMCDSINSVDLPNTCSQDIIYDMATLLRTEVNKEEFSDVHTNAPTMEKEYIKDIPSGHVVHLQDHNIYPLIKFLLCSLVIAEQIRRIENFVKDGSSSHQQCQNTTSLRCSSDFFQPTLEKRQDIFGIITKQTPFRHTILLHTICVNNEKTRKLEILLLFYSKDKSSSWGRSVTNNIPTNFRIKYSRCTCSKCLNILPPHCIRFCSSTVNHSSARRSSSRRKYINWFRGACKTAIVSVGDCSKSKILSSVPFSNQEFVQGANQKAPLSRSFNVSEEWVTKIDFYVFWEIIISHITLKYLALQAGAKHMKDILRKCRTLKEITKEHIRSAVLYHSLVIMWKNGHKLFSTNNRTTISSHIVDE
ncbi:hypothetical protein RhiirB3_440708 [Rhizophagus irregularis]|nr:hypothetical protein RhiirB3_440708 [Rhizophagus irregularis]